MPLRTVNSFTGWYSHHQFGNGLTQLYYGSYTTYIIHPKPYYVNSKPNILFITIALFVDRLTKTGNYAKIFTWESLTVGGLLAPFYFLLKNQCKIKQGGMPYEHCQLV